MRGHEIEYLKSQLFDIELDKYDFEMRFGDN